MRSSEDDERALGVGGRERGVSGAIRVDAAERADVRSGDGEHASGGRGGPAVEVAAQGGGELGRF